MCVLIGIVPVTLCSVGTGSLTLRTNTLFMRALQEVRSFYLSICVDSTQFTFMIVLGMEIQRLTHWHPIRGWGHRDHERSLSLVQHYVEHVSLWVGEVFNKEEEGYPIDTSHGLKEGTEYQVEYTTNLLVEDTLKDQLRDELKDLRCKWRARREDLATKRQNFEEDKGNGWPCK